MSLHRSLEPQERVAALRRRATPDAAEHGATHHPLLNLQRQVGNAQIARMLAQREGAEEEEVQAKHDVAQREGDEEEEVQAKHDLMQREGEEEEEVQAMHDPALAQREGDEEKEEVQAKPEIGLEGGPISGELSGRINTKRGSGTSLDDGVRTNMEAGFGTSFKDVRVHTDSEADTLNRSISAKAFTTGNDIFFRKDTSPSDSTLLAHELTHVVQQRSMSSGGGMTVGPAGDTHEQHADTMASAVTSGAAAAAAQREADEAQAQRVIAREAEEEKEEQ
jgi:hypothetical protein